MKLHNCAICGSDDSKLLWVAYKYIAPGGCPPDICQNCGFVYQRARRTSAEIADDWRRLYSEKIYDPTWPGVKARLYYVAEWIDQNIGLEGKELLDIGGGEGAFVILVNDRGARTHYFDPSFHEAGPRSDDPLWAGPILTVEEFQPKQQYDIVTILWTLENCGDPNAMIAKARECLKPDGHLIVATGSRILVPFRKPMSQYFSTEPQDLHSFRWSLVSLTSILTKHRFYEVRKNDFMQNDVLLVSAQPADEMPPDCFRAIKDDSAAVENYFIDWYRSFP